jgi:hypothetical protein
LRGFISASAYVVSAGSGGVFHCSILGSMEYNADKAQKVWNVLYDNEIKNKVTFSRQDVALLLDSEIVSNNGNLSKFGVYEITTGQLYEGLNLFYNDFKNKQIMLYSAVYLVKRQIEGGSAEEVEGIVQWLRGGGKDIKKRFYVDKEGKKKYSTFP